MKTTMFNIERICKEFNSVDNMEYEKLYEMPATMKVETPSGYKHVLGFVKKCGNEAFVKLSDDSIVEGIDIHLLKTPNGINEIKNLKVGDLVSTISGDKRIIDLQILDNIIDVFDLAVDSDDHLYVTANGVIHHNTGKTQTVEDTLAELGKTDGNGYFKVTTSASPSAMYEILYKNKKSMVLFDDCDGALDTQDGRNMIKAATDTKHVRKVSWAKKGGGYYDPDAVGDSDDGEDDIGDKLPRHFEYTGKIIFISNLPINKLDPDGAIRTRAMMIELNPTNNELYEFLGIIYNKIVIRDEDGQIRNLSNEKRREVVMKLKDIIAKKSEYTVDLRFFIRALCLAGTGLPNWERMLKYS